MSLSCVKSNFLFFFYKSRTSPLSKIRSFICKTIVTQPIFALCVFSMMSFSEKTISGSPLKDRKVPKRYRKKRVLRMNITFISQDIAIIA